MRKKHGTRRRMLAWSHDRLEDERRRLMLLAVDPSTHKSYSSALHSYIQFCAIHSLDISPTPNTMSLYISFMSSAINPRSVSAYLSGIAHCLEPSFPSIRGVRKSSMVTRTLRGALRSHGKPVQRKKALSTSDLKSIVSSFHPPYSSYYHKMIFSFQSF
jgi:hypothetical protein